MCDFQGHLQLQVLFWAQNEGNFRLNWKAAESSHTHEITKFVQLHEWLSKVQTASCDALDPKWRQHPFQLKGSRSLSNAWNHQICSFENHSCSWTNLVISCVWEVSAAIQLKRILPSFCTLVEHRKKLYVPLKISHVAEQMNRARSITAPRVKKSARFT